MSKARDPKIEEYIASKQVSGEIVQHTATEYRRDLERMGQFLEKRPTPPYYKLYDASKNDINRFLNLVRENNKVNSTNRKLAAIKGFFQFLYREGYRRDNPADEIQLPKSHRALREFVLTRPQMKKLLNAPSENFKWKDFGLRDRAMLYFYYSGPKRGELPDVRVTDVDVENKKIRVNGRDVPLSDEAAKTIGGYMRARPDVSEKALFLTNTNHRMTVRQAWVILKKYVRQTGLPEETDIETLRASYAVHALEDGVWFMDVLSALGNVNTAILQNYARLANVSHRKDGGSVDEALSALTTLNETQQTTDEVGFISLLHPKVIQATLHHYKNGHYREAVLNGMLVLTEVIRSKSGLDTDGVPLVSQVFKPEEPLLVFADQSTTTGRDEHRGFHKIMLGAFEGVRNPKSHRLLSDLTETSAAQYLVFISLLVRRAEDASKPR